MSADTAEPTPQQPADLEMDMGALLDSEFQIVPGLNEVAYELLRQEARVVRAWRHLPMGTSIAAIAVPTAS